MDSELSKFLDGVVGVVEANSYEQLCIWQEFHQELGKSWIQNPSGLLETVGHLGRMPVCISLFTVTVDGHKLLFIDPTSQVVDHRMIDAWVDKVLPHAGKNRTNAMNFCNIFRELAHV